MEESKTEVDPFVHINEEGEIIVDENHPEVILAVENALTELSKTKINLPASDYITVLEDEIKVQQSEMSKNDPMGPK